MSSTFISSEEVCRRLAINSRDLRRMRERGTAPTWVTISPRKTVYLESAVQAFIEGRIAPKKEHEVVL